MRRIALIAVLLLGLAGCSAGGGHASRQPTTKPAPTYYMVSPASYKQLDLRFANELYLYTGLALQMVKQPKASTLAPAIQQFNKGLAEVQAGDFQELGGWLRQWNQPLPEVSVPAGPVLNANPVPKGLSLSPDGVRELSTMSGQAYTVGFLNLLISDQEDALQVATAEQEGGSYGPGRRLATEVVEGSTAAIVTLRSVLHQKISGSQ